MHLWLHTKRLGTVFAPAILAAAVWWLRPHLADSLGNLPEGVLQGLPPATLALCIALGVLFHQSRLAALAIVFAAAIHFTGRADITPARLALASVLLPVTTVVSCVARDLRSLSWPTLTRLALGLVAAGFIALADAPALEAIVRALRRGPAVADQTGLPPLALGLTVPAVIVALGVRRRRTNAIALQALCLGMLALHFAQRGEATTGLTAATLAAAVLLWTLLDGAWQHAFLDELTGLPGRRPLEHHLAALGRRYSLAMVDIDHFKRINDRHGHDVGDQVLRFVASNLQARTRGTVYRYGGEEFVLVLRGTDRDRHMAALEALRERIAGRPFIVRSLERPRRRGAGRRKRRKKSGSSKRGRGAITVTVSIGLAGRRRSDRTPNDVLRAADKALYKAKRAGRNRVCAA